MELLRKIGGLFRQPERNESLGRNETCWCGSGKKYKRCHLDSDRQRLQSKRNSCSTAS